MMIINRFEDEDIKQEYDKVHNNMYNKVHNKKIKIFYNIEYFY